MKYYTMRNLYVLIITLFTGSCNNNSIYIERTSVMGNTIAKGEKLLVKKTDSLKRMDIVLFRFKDIDDHKEYKISSRVIGVPGDLVLISNRIVFVNGKQQNLPPTIKYHFRIALKYETNEMIKDMDIHGPNSNGFYACYLSDRDSIFFSKKYEGIIISMKKGLNEDLNQKVLLKHKNTFGWTEDNFGPIKLPEKGNSTSLDSANIFFNQLNEKDKSSGRYIITKNLYFIMSDNFHDGIDSRDLGLISYDQIIGVLTKQ
jgi:signal peptidase I